ncbi:MAG: bifunctional diaminohydroxyphosphoribosylaminopyrimidine deaminase/5-amino-6-(5-phosphoribosylamino)uracil reductase RibD [Myxococcales bacterium]|nr:bifunctional diaminohydroxyphosphoribosylaminopyrimidine deaminase/5-amino-6-(5-phosphoribosylamino)uracil reductase RibD [Myxococcales bacterium]
MSPDPKPTLDDPELTRDERLMARALELAFEADGRTSPNPIVGCVIVRDDAIVAEGFHRRAGERHAEIEALSQIGFDARGCELFVTLEPCSHHGRTPPCVDALLRAKPRRVVVGMVDPNPLVQGQGLARMREAGIEVASGVLESQCQRANESFSTYITLGRPFVTLKLAASLDGRIATRTGASRWISGEEARSLVHQWRDKHDAILTGSGTARLDDPSLTARPGRDPIRVVVDSRLSLRRDLRLFTQASDAPTWIATTVTAPSATFDGATSVELLSLPASPDGVDLDALLRELARRGITRLLVEAGARLSASLVRAGLVDRLALFLAPRLIGGDGAPLLGSLGVTEIDELVELADLTLERIGRDLLIRARIRA